MPATALSVPPPRKRWHFAVSVGIALLGTVGLVALFGVLRDPSTQTGAVAEAVGRIASAPLGAARHAERAQALAEVAAEAPGPFDRAAAERAIRRSASSAAEGCGLYAPAQALVSVALSPSGKVAKATIHGGLGRTSTGRCIAAAIESVRLDPFRGGPQPLRTTLRLE